MATKNLFSKSNSVTVKTKISDEKSRIDLNDVEFFKKVNLLDRLQERMKSDKAQADILSDEIKELSKEEWVRLYEKNGNNPGSIQLESYLNDEVASVMYVPSDKYINLNADKADHLIEKYGADIIEEKTIFTFDNTMIEKYGEIISMMIINSKDIQDEDKEKIIKASTTYSIAKGTIDKLKSFGPIGEVMEEVKPVVSLKNIQIVQSSKK